MVPLKNESGPLRCLDHRHPPRRGTHLANAPLISFDEGFGLVRINPIAPWSDEVMQDYIDTNGVLVNPLCRRRLSVDRLRTARAKPEPDPTSAVAVGPAAPRQNVGCTHDHHRYQQSRRRRVYRRVPEDEFTTPGRTRIRAIHIFREVAGEFERPVILFSGGKDSTVLLHLALKAFWPAPLPFALLHVDTGHNLPEIIEFRDEIVERHNLRLHVASVEEYLTDGRLTERPTASAIRCRPSTARRDHREPVRRGVRRRSPRRGAFARQGADLLPCATPSASGIPSVSVGTVEPVQRPARTGRTRACSR